MLSHVAVRYSVPHERIVSFKEYAIRRLQRRIVHEAFWALRDVTIEVQRGEFFGVVGRNGAGKSTLLRAVAGVLRPTDGRVVVRGHVAPLLEIGAGFHPELTGRENVFLNGTLLGHSRRDIHERFDEIVSFAELGDFIDSPLRTYSSGMVARLGFGVATAWEPDVLLVDEVLSVGDEGFQRKCLERIEAFRRKNAALLLVTHDLGLLERFCDRALWLDHGTVRRVGSPAEVAHDYHVATTAAQA